LRRRAGPHDHAAACRGPGGLAPALPPAPRARRIPRFAGAFDGNNAGLPRRGGRGGDARARWLDSLRGSPLETGSRALISPVWAVTSRAMGFSDVWNRTLVYFGIAEEEDWDEDGYATNEELERSYKERPNVRRLSPRRRQPEFEEWSDDAA